MSRIISFCNQKGGVGKTTCCANLALFLASKGKNVLCIDFDQQGSLSGCLSNETNSHYDKNDNLITIVDVLKGEKNIADALIHVNDNLDLLPCNDKLMEFKEKALSSASGNFKLRNLIKNNDLRKKYDFILIDTLPSLDITQYNALFASDEVIIPLNLCDFALQGVTTLLMTIESLKEADLNVRINGFLINKYESKRTKDEDIYKEIEEIAKDKGIYLYKNRIRNLSSVARIAHKDISEYVLNEDIINFGDEFLNRV